MKYFSCNKRVIILILIAIKIILIIIIKFLIVKSVIIVVFRLVKLETLLIMNIVPNVFINFVVQNAIKHYKKMIT